MKAIEKCWGMQGTVENFKIARKWSFDSKLMHAAELTTRPPTALKEN
jgi:hypothetical protein